MILTQPRNTTLYKIGKTDTYRVSHTQLFDTYGSNLGNVEKSMRRIYVPDGFDVKLLAKYVHYLSTGDLSIFTDEERSKTYVLVQVDQSGAEALIVSYLTRAANYRQLFLNNIRPHVFIGLAFKHHWEQKFPQIHEIAKLSIPNIKGHAGWKELERAIKDSDNNKAETRYYYHYKQTCHSSNYDIRASTFQLNMLEKSKGKVVLTKLQAEEYLSGYFTLFPEIREWHSEVRTTLHKTKCLYNLFGYPRLFPFIPRDEDLKEAYAFIPQSTVGCITHVAYTNMQRYIEEDKRDWHLLNNCHDSYLLQVPIGQEKEAATKAQEFMNQKLRNFRGEDFYMKSEAQIGMCWSPAKEPPKDKDLTDPAIIEKYCLHGLREIK